MTPMRTTTDAAQEVLQQLGVTVASANGREIAAHCPFHTDSHPSFSMNAEKGVWICYQCGRAGTLEMLISQLAGAPGDPKTLLRSIRHAGATQRLRERRQAAVSSETESAPVIDPFIVFARYDTFGSPPSWALQERMLLPEVCAHYGVRWDKGWIIPIWSPEGDKSVGHFWGWQFKRLDSVANFPPAVKKSRTLFGLHEARGSSLILVESPLDVVRLASVGFTAVASYGAFVSNEQLSLLIERSGRVVLALDADEEGQRQTAKVYRRVARAVPTTWVRFPRGAKDPGDLTDRQAVRVFGELV